MKKNIFSVIITVLTVVNVVLTAIMFFIMVPTFNKTNNLITQVASVLNLELDGDSDAKGDADYKISDLEDTTVSFDSQQTINLKTGSDNSQHYAMLSGYTISVNKKADDQCIKYRDNSGFCRRSDTAVDTSKDDDRAQESEEAFFEHFQKSFVMKLLNFGMDLGFVLAVAFAVIDRIDHEQGSDHETRDDSGKEQVADGSTGCHTVHDERDTRRDDNPQASGNGNDCSGKCQVISQIGKDRDGHTSYGCNSSRSRSGDRTVEKAGYDNGTRHSCCEFTKKVSENIE